MEIYTNNPRLPDLGRLFRLDALCPLNKDQSLGYTHHKQKHASVISAVFTERVAFMSSMKPWAD